MGRRETSGSVALLLWISVGSGDAGRRQLKDLTSDLILQVNVAARPLGDNAGEHCTGRETVDNEAFPQIHAQFFLVAHDLGCRRILAYIDHGEHARGVSTYPLNGLVAVVDPRWPRKLRSKPVVDVHDDDTVRLASGAAFQLVGVEVSYTIRAS